MYFLDMDGVLVDFIGGVEREFGCEPGSLKRAGNYDLHEVLGISYGALSNRLRAATEDRDFWLALHPTPWAHQLWELLRGREVFVVSAPWPGDYQCFAQKVEWCLKYLGLGSDRVILTPHKHLLSDPGRILLDDLPGNCERWSQFGGHSVLFPCQHNGKWHPIYDEDPAVILDYVRKRLLP